MRVRSNTADAAFAQVAEGLEKAGRLDDGHLEDGSHRASHRATQEGAAASFPDNQGLGAEGRAIPDQRAEILGAGETIGCRQESRLPAARDDFRQRRHCRNLPHRQQALVHREAGERFQ